MLFFNKRMLDEYKKGDKILEHLIHRDSIPAMDGFVTNQWLIESLPKRMIYYHLYGDIIDEKNKKLTILDVGGGWTDCTAIIIKSHHYKLLDFIVHDSHENMRKMEEFFNRDFWINEDWYCYNKNEKFDIVVANDLFPNVDQRLEIFLDKFLKISHELRLSLTFFNQPKFYPVKRIDAEERMCILSWNAKQLKSVLINYMDRIECPKFDIFDDPQKLGESIFSNSRQVCMVKLRGDA